jgi:hypothetical protein
LGSRIILLGPHENPACFAYARSRSTDSGLRPEWRSTICAALGLAVCLALAGCITTPLEDRDRVEIQTQHYDVWSSLPPGSCDLDAARSVLAQTDERASIH